MQLYEDLLAQDRETEMRKFQRLMDPANAWDQRKFRRMREEWKRSHYAAKRARRELAMSAAVAVPVLAGIVAMIVACFL